MTASLSLSEIPSSAFGSARGTDLQFRLIGPLWLLVAAYRRFSLRY
jgi:hypothetical protein